MLPSAGVYIQLVLQGMKPPEADFLLYIRLHIQ